jgi:hypothetical protein
VLRRDRRSRRTRRGARLALATGWTASLLLASQAVAAAAAGQGPADKRFPAPECEAYVAYDRDMTLPGYLVRDGAATAACVPFTTVGRRPPRNYAGDFYVDEFAEAALRARWLSCKADAACSARVARVVDARSPPNREHRIVDPHHRYLLGKVPEATDLALDVVRRPGFFARAPYFEPIATVEPHTHTVEFTAPPEAYERIHRALDAPVKLRGWYLRGQGVVDASGKRRRALVVMTGGGGTRLVAIEHPSDRL